MIGLTEQLNFTHYWSMVNVILHQYFSNTTVMVLHGEKSADDFFTHAAQGVATAYVIQNIQNSENLTYPRQPPPTAAKIHHFVFIYGNDFKRNLPHWKRNYAWNPRGRVIALEPEGSKTEGEKIIQEVWNLTRASNMVVVVQDKSEPVMMTWQPNGPNECKEVQTIHTRTVLELFKNNIDMRNCNLYAQTASISPYILRNQNSKGEYTDGIEIKALQAIAKTHFMSIVYVRKPDGESVFDTHDQNGSLVGPMARLNDYKIDIAFSCFGITPSRFYISEPLQPHTDEEVTWIVPTPRSILYSISIFSAFDFNLTVLMVVIFTAVTILYHTCDSLLTWSDSLILTLNSLLFSPVERLRKGNYVTIFVYIFSLHLITAYQSSLLILLVKSPTEPPIESIDQGVDAGLRFTLLPSLRHVYNASEKGWAKLFKANRYIYSETGESLKAAAINKTVMVLTGKSVATYCIGLYSLVDENGQPQLNFLKSRYIGIPIAMFMYMGHPLQPKFLITSIKLHESGLLDYWRSQYMKKSKAYSPPKSEVFVLTWQNLQGVFLTWLVTLLGSFLTFNIELIHAAVLKKRQIGLLQRFDKRKKGQPPRNRRRMLVTLALPSV